MTREQRSRSSNGPKAPSLRGRRSRLRPDTTPKPTASTVHTVVAIFDLIAKVIGGGMTALMVVAGIWWAALALLVFAGAGYLTIRSFRMERKWVRARLILGVPLAALWGWLLVTTLQPPFLAHLPIELATVTVCALALRRISKFEQQHPDPDVRAFE